MFKLLNFAHKFSSRSNFHNSYLVLSKLIYENDKVSASCSKFIQNTLSLNLCRHLTVHEIDKPSPHTTKKNLRYKVHYPDDGQYTIKRLPITKLGGRDPETGRVIFGCVGGGAKQKFRWVVYDRLPAGSEDPLVERVIHVQYDPLRTARIALVGQKDQLRFIIATESMKKGDLITSTRFLPRMKVRPQEGNAYPVGALPSGTVISCIEKSPHNGATLKVNGGSSCVINRTYKGKVIIQLDSKQEAALDPNCLVSVDGKKAESIGSSRKGCRDLKFSTFTHYIRLPFIRVNVNRTFFLSNALKLWESLPDSVKMARSCKSFKKRFTKFILGEGRVSNDNHSKRKIGSAQRLRWLGRRPRSGLWQRKTGYHGFKKKKTPPIKHFYPKKAETTIIKLDCPTEGPRTPVIPRTLRVT